MRNYIGIDISKSSLSVYVPKNDLDFEVENTPKGLKQLFSKLKKLYGKEYKNIIWIYEPTGSYSMGVKKFCNEYAITCFIVKPSQSSTFAKTLKQRGKNDLVDARMLYRMHVIANDTDFIIPEYDEILDKIKSYIRYYKSTVKERVIKTNQLEASLHRGDDSFILRKLRSKIKALKKEEKEIILIILDLINTNEEYALHFKSITSFKGIGNISGIVLFELFINYKDANIKEITALSGLDPIQIISGSSVRKKSRISKQGSRLIRSTLFMPTLIAINHNPNMQKVYERLKDNGKHTTAAQVAVMRKILTITFSLFKNKQLYKMDFKENLEKEKMVA